MGDIRRNLVHQRIHRDPLSQKNRIPGVIIKPAPKMHQPGLDPGRNSRSPGKGRKQNRVFIAVAHAVFKGLQGIGHRKHRTFFDILENPFQ